MIVCVNWTGIVILPLMWQRRQGPLGTCLCATRLEDENNHCIEDKPCDSVQKCTSDSNCAIGEMCVKTCCGVGNCFPTCNTSNPNQVDHSDLICAAYNWTCGEEVTQCGALGAIFHIVFVE